MNICMNMLQKILTVCLLIILTATCTDDIENEYASHRAYLRYTNVATTAPLRTALDNPGMFCTIRYDNRYYYFAGSDGTAAQQPRTAADNYGTPMSIAGFIVGTPAVPNLSSGTHTAAAYDLVCPTCYANDAIERSLMFDYAYSAGNIMKCYRCMTSYDLNASGIPINGKEESRRLFKYRLSYSPATGTMVIQN